MNAPRKTVLSAVQPTNPMTLGNFVGAIRHWPSYQCDYDCVFFAVDRHAITLRQDPRVLRENTYRLMATFIAGGLDPERTLLFVQSHVPEHTALAWTLTCHCYMGELSRMTQYKDKATKQGANIPAGLFTYPTLMAADILLYQAHYIPVGSDQKQHVELTRDLALRMNRLLDDEAFTLPEPLIPKIGARIMSLQDPTKKMSKSDADPKATIYLTDSDQQIRKKLKAAVTDSGRDVLYAEDQPGVRNLIDIQSVLTGESPEAIVARYAGKQYGHLKVDTAEHVVAALAPLREQTERLLEDRGELDRILARGAERARERAAQTLRRVDDALGFVLPQALALH